MQNNIDQLLKKAVKLEKDDSQLAELAEVYHEIAPIYHKQKIKKNEE